MAHRDKTQGFAFVYVNVAELLKSSREKKVVDISSHEPTTAPAHNFNKDSKPEASKAATQIRENLDRLQSLHHKLHAMLADLSQTTGASKKKKGS